MKKILLGLLLFLLVVGTVYAVSLNLGARTRVDFGKMQLKERKTLGYPVWGYYYDGEYNKIWVEHPVEGEIADWIKVRHRQHWVGPTLPGTIPPYPEPNVFVTLRIPENASSGNYIATVNNIVCMPRNSMIGMCVSIPTTIEVEVI